MNAEAVMSAHAVRIRACVKPERVAADFFMVRFLSNRWDGREVDGINSFPERGVVPGWEQKFNGENRASAQPLLTKRRFPCGLCRDPLHLAFPSFPHFVRNPRQL